MPNCKDCDGKNALAQLANLTPRVQQLETGQNSLSADYHGFKTTVTEYMTVNGNSNVLVIRNTFGVQIFPPLP